MEKTKPDNGAWIEKKMKEIDITEENNKESRKSDFIREMIREDLSRGKYSGVITRFPPEPNGYLHIGHAKSIVLNFGVAEEFRGRCHLRFDDTNPETEDEEYAEAIKNDIRWLGYDWGSHLYYASDYFEKFYDFAVELIEKGLAYVDSRPDEEIRKTRGTVMEAGIHSPWRNRSPSENLELFRRMKEGEFEDGEHVLRAKIDMSASNMKMRDPLLYRIRNLPHYRTGDKWHIYPMYDFAHCLEDAIERISHSLCTLEFENNRDIYDWVLENVTIEKPRSFQTEFARLSLTYTIMSKRKLLAMVRNGHVEGWDDPRMPTLAGMRRRGYTPEAIRAFCEDIGVAKTNSTVEIERLEHAVRKDLNAKSPRMMGVIRPLKLIVENWPEDKVLNIDAPLWPHDLPGTGSRKLPFSRDLFIEEDDFMEEPPGGYRRLFPGSRVRLRHAYIVECTGFKKDDSGEIAEVHVKYEPDSMSNESASKVRGAIHWVSAPHAVNIPLRLYGRLFTEPCPEADKDRNFEEFINHKSLEKAVAVCEPAVLETEPGKHIQLERTGYFYADHVESRKGSPVLNRTVLLRDSRPDRKKSQASAKKGSCICSMSGTFEGSYSRSVSGTKKDIRSQSVSESRTGKRKDSHSSKVRQRGQDAKPFSGSSSPSGPVEGTLADSESVLMHESQRVGKKNYTAQVDSVKISELVSYGIREDEAKILLSRPQLNEFFRKALVYTDYPEHLGKWIVNDLSAVLKERSIDALPFGPKLFADLVSMIASGETGARNAKVILEEMTVSGESPREIIERLGLNAKIDKDALAETVENVIAQHPVETEKYRTGKTALFGFFIGKIMAATKGKADPKEAGNLLKKALEDL